MRGFSLLAPATFMSACNCNMEDSSVDRLPLDGTSYNYVSIKAKLPSGTIYYKGWIKTFLELQQYH